MFTLPNSPIKARLYLHGSNTGVVQARYKNCEGAFCYITYAVVGTDLVITQFAVHSRATTKEAQAAGDEIDVVLEKEAQMRGLRRLLLIHPDDTVEVVREYEVQPFTIEFDDRNKPIAYLN